MSGRHRTSWVFGSFVSDSWDSMRASSRWHVLRDASHAYCGLQAVPGMVEDRAWADGPPSGAVCAGCSREFVLALGMTPEQVSEAARERRARSESRVDEA